MDQIARDESSAPRGAIGPFRGLLWLLVLLAIGLFLWRGPVRAMGPGMSADFALVQGAAVAFWAGENPYDAAVLDEIFRQTGAGERFPQWRGSRDLLYPPTTFLLYAPFGVVDFPAGRIAWLLLNCLSVGVVFESLRRLIGAPLRSDASLLLGAVTLAWAPALTTFAYGQTPLPVLACVCAGHALRSAGRPKTAGVLFGIAAALKPQIGLVFIAYEAFRRRWWTSGVALALLLALIAAATVRLHVAEVDWLTSLRGNVEAFTNGGAGDPTPANPIRHQLLNLHYPLHELIESRAAVQAGVLAIVTALSLWYFVVWVRRREERTELLTLAMACPLSLLLVYHRTYDAVLVLIPVAWGLREALAPVPRVNRRYAIAALVCCAVFLLPSGAILHYAESRQWVPPALAESTAYAFIVRPHVTWALVGLCVALTLALSSTRRATPAVFRREPESAERLTRERG